MKKMKWTIRIAVLAAAVFMPLRATMIYVSEAVAVDDCLDVGGSFNYETMTCDFERSHPYVPFSARHPGLFRQSGVCFIMGMVLFTGTMLLTRSKQEQNQASQVTARKLAEPER
jgi:hypothetical protein